MEVRVREAGGFHAARREDNAGGGEALEAARRVDVRRRRADSDGAQRAQVEGVQVFLREAVQDDGHGRRHGDPGALDERQQSARVVGFGERESARRHARRHPDQQPRASRHRRENADVVVLAHAQSRAVCAGEAHLRPFGPFAQLRKAAGAARDRDHGNLIEAESPGGNLLHGSRVLGRPGQLIPGQPTLGRLPREVDAKRVSGPAKRLIRPGIRQIAARIG